MGIYTEELDNKLWEISSIDETTDDPTAIAFLNTPNSFLSFGEGILRIIQTKAEYVTANTAPQYIREACRKNNVPPECIASPGTLSNWFSKGMRPKKGETSRKSMYALSFALELSVDETADLFHKVYLDRAFNYRNKQEFVYYYCLKNKRKWNDAENILSATEKLIPNTIEQTIYTIALQNAASDAVSDIELIDYISSHPHNFEQSSITVKRIYSELISNAKNAAREELDLPEYENAFMGKWRYGEEISNNLLYEVITGISVSGKKGTTTVFKNANLPKEIKTRFPEAATLGKNIMTSEEQRKVIILLFSYCMWFYTQHNNILYDYDDYTSELDQILFECNYSPLYLGNPFDWMFLYCSQEDRPLDMFRDIIQEALNEE